MPERALRIALTTESFLPYLSGVTVSVDALARGLGARGHEVLVVAPRPARGASVTDVGSPGPEPTYAWLDSYQLPRLAPASYRMAWPHPLAEAWSKARDFMPDIVHAHSPFVTGVFARRLARVVGAPLAFTHHTRFADYGHYLGPLARPGAAMTDAYLRRFWAGCAGIIAPSGDLADEIRERLPERQRRRVRVIPTGVDVDAIRALERVDPRPVAGWPAAAVVIGTLGRLAPEKSPGTILEAVALVAARHTDARLLVIGGGQSEAELRSRADRPDLVGRVAFTGSLPRMEALARLSGADLFAFASRTETQGLVLAEAIAAGLPAVAISGPGVGDSIRDGIDGLVVPAEPTEGKVARLADALSALVADDDRRKGMAERARADADRFAVGVRVAEVEALYRSLIA
ncbi:MAG TPA: glycosyltransferase [Candidatus Limnocylindria bacterium]